MADNKKEEDFLDKLKATASSTAQTIGKEAGGLAVKATIKSGALAMSASKMSMKAMTKVAGYGATTEARAEIKELQKEIKQLNKTIEEKDNIINQLRIELGREN